MKLPKDFKDLAHQYGDAPNEQRYRDQMIAIMKTLDEFVNPGQKAPNKKTAVVVMMFDYGDGPGRCNYISNGVSRKDMVTLLKEQAARFEGQPEVSGKA